MNTQKQSPTSDSPANDQITPNELHFDKPMILLFLYIVLATCLIFIYQRTNSLVVKSIFFMLFPFLVPAIQALNISSFDIPCNSSQTTAILIILLSVFAIFEVIMHIAHSCSKQHHIESDITSGGVKTPCSKDLETRMTIHNFKNLLFVIYGYLETGNIDKAQQKIFEISESLSNDISDKTNPLFIMVNKLVESKKIIAEKHNIKFSDHVEINHTLNIKDTHLCSIVGNALDNSIEACCKIQNLGDRFINLSITSDCEKLYILVENSASLTGNLDLSTTKSGGMHGLGLKDIDHIVSIYHGTKKITHDLNKFTLGVKLPPAPIL